MDNNYIFEDKNNEIVLNNIKAALFDYVCRYEIKLNALESTIGQEPDENRKQFYLDVWAKANKIKDDIMNTYNTFYRNVVGLDATFDKTLRENKESILDEFIEAYTNASNAPQNEDVQVVSPEEVDKAVEQPIITENNNIVSNENSVDNIVLDSDQSNNVDSVIPVTNDIEESQEQIPVEETIQNDVSNNDEVNNEVQNNEMQNNAVANNDIKFSEDVLNGNGDRGIFDLSPNDDQSAFEPVNSDEIGPKNIVITPPLEENTELPEVENVNYQNDGLELPQPIDTSQIEVNNEEPVISASEPIATETLDLPFANYNVEDTTNENVGEDSTISQNEINSNQSDLESIYFEEANVPNDTSVKETENIATEDVPQIDDAVSENISEENINTQNNPEVYNNVSENIPEVYNNVSENIPEVDNVAYENNPEVYNNVSENIPEVYNNVSENIPEADNVAYENNAEESTADTPIIQDESSVSPELVSESSLDNNDEPIIESVESIETPDNNEQAIEDTSSLLDITNLKRVSVDEVKAIIVNKNQFDKLNDSYDNEKNRLYSDFLNNVIIENSNSIINGSSDELANEDINNNIEENNISEIEDSVIQDNSLEEQPSEIEQTIDNIVNDEVSQKDVEVMLEKANQLYKDGKTAEAQAMYDEISAINQASKQSPAPELVKAA